MPTSVLPLGARRNSLLLPALLACYLIWGSTYFAIRIALPSFPPFFQMGTRFLVAGGLLMAWLLARGHALPSCRAWRNALVIGALMLGGGMGLTAQASVHIGSGLIATFIAVVPMLTCGWGLLFGKRPSALELLGMATGLAGVLLLVSLALGEQPQWPPTAAATAAWLYLVLAGSLIAFSAYLYLLAHATPALATSYAFVNPLIALFLGVGLAGEVVTAKEWLACGVILLGVVFILLAGQMSRKR